MVAFLQFRGGKGGLELGGDDFEGLGVYDFHEVVLVARLGHGEEAIVEANFGVEGVFARNPVDCAFDLARGGCAAGFAGEVGSATEFGELTGRVFDDFVALDDEAVTAATSFETYSDEDRCRA